MCAVYLMLMCFVSILLLLYYLSRNKFDYWEKRKVPFMKPLTLFGNFKDFILLKTYYPQITRDICEQFPDAPYVGAFFGTEPALIVKDPELIKLVTTKDFYYFHGRDVAKYTHKELTTQNLFFTYGDRWRVIRQNLTPLFSSAKLKNMFPLIAKCTVALDAWLREEVKGPTAVDVRALMADFTMDCTGSCIFGVNTNTLAREPPDGQVNPFKIISHKLSDVTTAGALKQVFRLIWPAMFYGLGYKVIEDRVTSFFDKLLTDVFISRDYKPVDRHDFVDLLLKLKPNKFVTGDSILQLKTGESNKISLEVDDKFLISNCVLLFAAGFDTSASALSCTLFELAKNNEVQMKAIAEADSYYQRHGVVSYHCVSELAYLEACLEETLRLHPALGVITREVMEDYTLPTGVRLDKGVRVHIPVYYLHHKSEYFADPEQYRPERFYGDARKNIKPFTYLPFGEGARICIGIRFAKMQTLAGLVTILRNYRLELAPGMSRTLALEPATITMQPKHPIRLKFIPRQ